MWIAIQNAVGARQGVGGGPPPPPPYTPPLDSIDSVAAYSVRKLRTDYSGPCMEVYRVSDGATTDIGFDSQGLLATAAIVSFASGSQVLVSTWYNQGTSGPDAVALAGERPEIYTGTSIRVMGSKPALYPQNAAVGFTDIPINISNLQPEPWTSWTNFSVSKAVNNFGVLSLFGGSVNRRINLITPFVPTSTDGALGGVAIDATGTGGIFYQGIDRGTFVTRGDTLAQFEEYQTISNIVGLNTAATTANFNDMTLGGTTYFGGYSMHIMQEVVVIPYLSLTGYNQALDINANNYYQVTNLPDYTSGFLADYSGAAVAYSVRKLSNTAIKALRVRRTVAPFDEFDIGFTPSGDLDEAAISTFGGGDSLVVSRWYDQSGNSNHAVQNTPNNQPLIYDGTSLITENGKPAIKFSYENNTTLSRLIYTPISATRFYHVWVMNQPTNQRLNWMNDGTANYYRLETTGQMYIVKPNDFDNAFGDIGKTGYKLRSIDRDSDATATAYVDGTSSNAWTGLDPSAFTYGRVDANFVVSGAGNHLNLQEFIIYDSSQTSPTNNRPAIETNIMTYYGIP